MSDRINKYNYFNSLSAANMVFFGYDRCYSLHRMQTLIQSGLTMILTMALIPSLIFISQRFQIVDLPNQRKVHERYVSRLGGIAMFLSVMISLGYSYFVRNFSINQFWKIILIGSLMSFALGLWDDLKNISPKKKLFFQFVIAITAYLLGFRITEVQVGFDNPLLLGHLSGIVTVLWIVTVMNAINMIDGLDGLAGGFAFLVFVTVAILGYVNENISVMTIAFMYAGACLGFLFFNFNPAKIFMGDAGSMTIGFILSVLTLSAGDQRITPISIFTPLFLLAFPLIDLLTAVLRRMILAKTMNKDISWMGLVQKTFHADGNHIHHRLLKLGFSQRRIAFVIYAFTLLNCLMGVASVYLPFSIIFFLFIFYSWFTVQTIRLLDYEEFVTSAFRNQKKQFEEKQKLSTAPRLVKRVT